MIKLWERYFFLELAKPFFFSLFAFFFLYALLDYATHMNDFIHDHHFQLGDLLQFYFHHFLKRACLLLPLSLLVATIKVLSTLNLRREWMVLQVAGLSMRRLLRPFFVAAALCTLFCWVNFEYLLPSALNKIDIFHATHFKESHRAKRKELLHILDLKDNSKLIYQGYDREKDALFDVLWVRSVDDIWRVKFLSANPAKPVGQYADHLVRSKNGFLEKAESFTLTSFPDLKWHPSMTGKSFIPFENRSIGDLYTLAFRTPTTTPYEGPKIVTQICFKCAIPLLSILAVMAVTPFCIRFSRHFNPFFIYAIALFGLLAFYMFVDSAVILGEHGALSPWAAIFVPFAVAGTFFTYRFIRAT